MKSVNKIAALAATFLFALSMTGTAQAATTRTTTVQVENHTGKTIEYMSVVHKYSDEFKESKKWKNIRSGRKSSKMKIRYNTGAFTTGQDWWYVAYKLKGENVIRYTNPRNGRNIIDAVEKFTKRNAKVVADQIGNIKTKSKKAEVAKRVAQIVIKETARHALNNESTAGFKKHVLRKSDQRKGVTIKLFSNNKVGFYSKSGKSTTRVSSKSALPR